MRSREITGDQGGGPTFHSRGSSVGARRSEAHQARPPERRSPPVYTHRRLPGRAHRSLSAAGVAAALSAAAAGSAAVGRAAPARKMEVVGNLARSSPLLARPIRETCLIWSSPLLARPAPLQARAAGSAPGSGSGGSGGSGAARAPPRLGRRLGRAVAAAAAYAG